MPSLVAGRDVNGYDGAPRASAGTPTEDQKRRLLSTSSLIPAQHRSISSMSNEGHWYGKPRDEVEAPLRVQNVQTVVNRGWDQLEPREGVSEEHVKLLLPQQRAPQVVDRLVYQEVKPIKSPQSRSHGQHNPLRCQFEDGTCRVDVCVRN